MNRRKRIPYFTARLNFDVATLMDTINFRQDAVAMGTPRQYSQAEFDQRVGRQSFGMWGGSQATATPGVKLEDVIPKPEDYVNIPYRFLSQTVVGAHSWKSTDFRAEGVLEESMPLFDGTPVFSDHETQADNAAGIVTGSTWKQAVTLSGGIIIPAGINAFASLDSKIQYALIRAILGGAIRSNSVSVQFSWQPSHSFDSINDFFEKLGTYDQDQQIVTRRVLSIQAYHETSMLYQGADPFAKKLDAEGNPERPDMTSVSYSKADPVEKEKYDKTKKFFVTSDFSKQELISLSSHYSQNGIPPESKPPTNTTVDMKKNLFLLSFMQVFGPSLGLSFSAPTNGEFTDAQEQEAATAIARLKTVTPEIQKGADFSNGLSFANQAGEVSAFNPQTAAGEYLVMLKSDHTAVTTKLTKLESDLQAAKAASDKELKDQQDFAVAAYKKASGDSFNQVISDVIATSTGDTLAAFTAQYAKDANMRFGATCTKCGTADHIEMRSSVETPKDGDTTPKSKAVDSASFKDFDHKQGNFTRSVRRG